MQAETEKENDVVATLPLHTIIYDIITTEKKTYNDVREKFKRVINFHMEFVRRISLDRNWLGMNWLIHVDCSSSQEIVHDWIEHFCYRAVIQKFLPTLLILKKKEHVKNLWIQNFSLLRAAFEWMRPTIIFYNLAQKMK